MSTLRGGARYWFRTLKRTQAHTGFFAAFLALCKSLRSVGCLVRINDFEAARRNPDHPIGLAGYPSVLPATDALPNPRIFGPGDFGQPPQSAQVAADPRMKLLIQPSLWYADYFRPYCGDKLLVWFAGIDTGLWRPTPKDKKQTDFLVYDKIRWRRDQLVPLVLERTTRALEERGCSFEIVRYGRHHRSEFSAALRRASAMIFLCEHETQGLAYQEALACDVPVLAWDEGELVDPVERALAPPDLKVSTVPYFDDRCGRRFTLANFERELDLFRQAMPSFTPRAYVEENLSQAVSASLYLRAYASLMAGGEASNG